MDQINSTSPDSSITYSDSVDYTVLKYTIILGLLTGLALECTSLIFKLDKDLGQIIVFPLVLIAYIYLLRSYLPRAIIQALLSTLILLIFSFLWTQGDFGTRGVSYVSKLLVGSAHPQMEQLRADFNRDSEVLNFPKLETIYRNFDDRSAEEWGKGSYRLLVYSDPLNPRLKLFLNELSKAQTVDLNGIKLRIQLFPEWVPIDPRGIPVDYLTTLTRVLPSLSRQRDELQKLEDLGFAGYAAGLARGRWNSPIPRAAALLLGASSNLAKGKILGKTEIKCIRRDLSAVLKKSKGANSPELRALALNNLAVAILKLNTGEQPGKAVGIAKRMFAQATGVRSTDGAVVMGARLATANLFALDEAGYASRTRIRKAKIHAIGQAKRTKHGHLKKRKKHH